MNTQEFSTTKITRKHFLQLSLVTIVGLLMWSPFREGAKNAMPALPANIMNALSMQGVSDIKVMTQGEYDTLSPEGSTMYIITA